MKKYDVIVVGGGMAGLTAGIYVVRAGKTILVLEAGAVGGQIITAPSVENWPGSFRMSGSDLMKSIMTQAIELGVEVKYEEVVGVSKRDAGFLVTTDEDEYECKAVIIAAGTEPR